MFTFTKEESISVQVALLRAAMIVKRAIRIGGGLLRTEANRAVELLKAVGLSMQAAVEKINAVMQLARTACSEGACAVN